MLNNNKNFVSRALKFKDGRFLITDVRWKPKTTAALSTRSHRLHCHARYAFRRSKYNDILLDNQCCCEVRPCSRVILWTGRAHGIAPETLCSGLEFQRSMLRRVMRFVRRPVGALPLHSIVDHKLQSTSTFHCTLNNICSAAEIVYWWFSLFNYFCFGITGEKS